MQNLLKLDIKVIVIVVLLLIIVFKECGNRPSPNTPPKTVKVDGKTYNVISDKKDTIQLPPLVTIKYKKGKDIHHDTTIYLPDTSKKPVDTVGIIKEYNAKNVYTDTLQLKDSAGYVVVKDTISQNKIQYRSWNAVVNRRLEKETLIVAEQPKTQVYVGLNSSLNQTDIINSVGAGFLLKTKSDHIYQLGLGLSHQTTNANLVPFIGVGMYWKIKLHK